MSDELRRGIALFNEGEFFEAHEALEDVWRVAPAEKKKFLQGLVQVAVAFHHHSTGNRIGMRSVLERACKNMSGCPRGFCGIDAEPLLKVLSAWLEAIDESRPAPPLPRIQGPGC
jgi:predicted metal-dependent hydrolase